MGEKADSSLRWERRVNYELGANRVNPKRNSKTHTQNQRVEGTRARIQFSGEAHQKAAATQHGG